MKRALRTWLAAALLGCAVTAVAAADGVTIAQDGGTFRARTAAYEIAIASNGRLASLKVHGQEFCPPANKVSGGAYFYQDGTLALPDVRRDGDAVVAKSEKAAIRYECGADSLTWKLTNTTQKPMEFVLLFDSGVNAVMDSEGKFWKPPVERTWETTTWFRGDAKLHISGATKEWGPFGDNYQVWIAAVDPGATKTVTLTPGTASAEEITKAAQAVPAPKVATRQPETAQPAPDFCVIKQPKYTATVAADGCMTSLRIGGTEMFSTSAVNPRGAYVFQDGPQKLADVARTSADVVTAKNAKASVRYEFGPDKITWTVTNNTAKQLICLIVFAKGIDAVQGEFNWWQKPPATFSWKSSTWFLKKANLKIDGSTRVWGPWSDGLQVWEARLDGKETHEIALQVNSASDAEIAKAEQVAVSPPPPPPTDPVGPMWDMNKLSNPPKTYPAEGFHAEGVKAIYYDGPPFRGQPTRVFAWLGLPKVAPGQKVPGIVLVHGGGGTAFDDWVRLWNSRGYAAISMDTCGCTPGGEHGRRPRHEFGGPPGWGGWNQIDWPREDQWTYHAVADAILADSLLRSLPEVDANRIGLTGISWGGYLTCIIAGVDHRLKFAAPVYGCGFTNEHGFAANVEALGKEKAARWMRWWDPSTYLPDATMPMLWVDGSNDFAYTLNALQKSYRLPKGPRTLCTRLRMPHGQQPGATPKEIQVFADSIVDGGVPLPKITGQRRDGDHVWATFQSKEHVVKAELNYTKNTGKWQDRKWETIPAAMSADGKVTATLPAGTRVYYINLTDDRDCVVSTEHEELAANGG